ncbi:TrmH family RNA methyltransferase [Paucimonas lemoignei]|uniref:TrmH family RNA methyltransferase n=1 Tax=Paucimonas lemoignei TaxID=29443 RepID=A0A4R3I1U4_PAULE|nr:RNA methyltransferase [Paucimonas lemoignei]TCS39522.1 TrmH family RNA methyltransferase [Paucimonas lemoignei]
MKEISSRENPLYKELKQLATSSQARRKAQRSLLDGVHLCEAYLQLVGDPLMCVLSQSARGNHEAADILAECEARRVSCIVLPDALYNALSQVEQGVGIFFLVATPQTTAPSILSQPAVLLDRLQDPGNLGSILRSAAAAGIRQVFCSPGTVFAWSPKVLRAGMGAHFLLEIVENADLAALLKTAALPVLATSSHARQTIYEIDLAKPVAWLFGHEGQGVAEDLLSKASNQVAIPHLGRVESLNVAASAAVCFFEQVRQTLQHR